MQLGNRKINVTATLREAPLTGVEVVVSEIMTTRHIELYFYYASVTFHSRSDKPAKLVEKRECLRFNKLVRN